MDLIIVNKIALYFGLQYKPFSRAEWKKNCEKMCFFPFFSWGSFQNSKLKYILFEERK